MNKTQNEAVEEIKVTGKQLVSKVKELIRHGNIRRITIKSKDGETLASFPLTFGVLGIVLVAPLALVAGLAALVTECTILVERVNTPVETTVKKAVKKTVASIKKTVKKSAK